MEKLNILFVIHRLGAGGAEKSLVSLLRALPLDMLNVDLMAVDPSGIFCSQVPVEVKMVDAPRELICQRARITDRQFWKSSSLRICAVKIYGIVSDHIRGKKNRLLMCHDQYYNEVWRKHIPECPKQYDVAISYIDGLNYYVIDHVKAKKKILWCHNDYNKLDYVSSYDRVYYEKADVVCTISETCRRALIENFPQFANKFKVIENISSARWIHEQSENLIEMEHAGDGFISDTRFRIVSIGRLTEQKGFEYAVNAARILKDKEIDFCWYVLGEGPLRKSLEEHAVNIGVSDRIKFIGIRSNPYPYIRLADVFAMPSLFEGKSIALDEAKILCRPIIVTDYPTVYDAIEDRRTGLIVKKNAPAIAAAILQLYNDKDLRHSLSIMLSHEDFSNEKQIVANFLKLLR